MKRASNQLLLGLASLLALGPFRAEADLEVSASFTIHSKADFHAPLTSHGTWVEVGSYGRCWQPARVAVEWRPYCDGSWVWTDCGWYWSSNEPWAWACYHYGWWTYDPVYRWVWVPGVEWAPAWVSWRFGSGYCGWAPLPPHGAVVAPSLYVFVESHRFHERVHPKTVIVNNTVIVNKTKVVNNVSRETRTVVAGSAPRQVVINNGPGVDPIQKATGKKISSVPIHQAAQATPVPPGLARKASEPARNEPASTPDRSQEPAERAPAPALAPPPAKPASLETPTPPEKQNPPEKPAPPQKSKPPGNPDPPPKDQLVPGPGKPQDPPPSPGKPAQPPKRQRDQNGQQHEQNPAPEKPQTNEGK